MYDKLLLTLIHGLGTYHTKLKRYDLRYIRMGIERERNHTKSLLGAEPEQFVPDVSKGRFPKTTSSTDSLVL